MCPPADLQSIAEPPHVENPINCGPLDELSQSGFAYVQEHVHPSILAHSLRVYLYAKALAERESSPFANADRLPLLFAAAIFHDAGTAAAHDGPQRFEIEGADAAVRHLRQFGVNEADAHQVWIAIALHASPQLAERIAPLARLIRLAVISDFGNSTARKLTTPDEIQQIEARYPRGPIEKVLGDAVVEQAIRQPEKGPPASWTGVLLRSHLEDPSWAGINRAF